MRSKRQTLESGEGFFFWEMEIKHGDIGGHMVTPPDPKST